MKLNEYLFAGTSFVTVVEFSKFIFYLAFGK
jgi:hypothetical protein